MRKGSLILGTMLLSISLVACGNKPVEVVSSTASSSPSISETSVSTSTEIVTSVSKEDTSIDTLPEETGDEEPKNPSDFVFTRDNYPTLDGSTSLRPLGLNMTSLLLGEPKENVDEMLKFHRTDDAYYYLMNGESDILIAAQGCDDVMNTYEENQFEYDIEPIAMEALVFVVNVDNPVNSLTSEQVKKIYTGEITNWSEVGGEDLDIVAFQRTETSGSQVMMRQCVMTDCVLSDAPKELMPADMGGLIDGVASYNNEANAIGYTVYYYADSMKMADGLKILKIDDIEPCNETIGSGEYPFRNPYYCVIAKTAEEGSPERRMFNWLAGDEGQKLVAESGYVPIKEMDLTKVEVQENRFEPKENKYTRLSEGYIGKYKAGTSNGNIFPFLLSTTKSMVIDEYDTTFVTRYGFVDETGMIVSDYGYSDVTDRGDCWQVSDYNGQDCLITYDGNAVIPIISWSHRYDVDLESVFFTDQYIYIFRCVIPDLDKEHEQDIIFTAYDFNGNKVWEKNLEYDKSIIRGVVPAQYVDIFRAVVGELMDEKYLTLITGNQEGFGYNILDLDTESIIVRDKLNIEMVPNHTFIVMEDYGQYALYNCDGNRIGDETFCKMEYIDDDYYLAKASKNAPLVLYHLVDSKLVEVTSMESSAFFVMDDFFASKKISDQKFTYYNPDGTLAERKEGNALDIFLKAKELGVVRINSYEWVDVDCNYYKDKTLNEQNATYYSNIIFNRQACYYEDYIFNISTGEKISLDLQGDGYYGYPSIIGGILCCDNELRNLKTGEVIFSYNPYIWDNVE